MRHLCCAVVSLLLTSSPALASPADGPAARAANVLVGLIDGPRGPDGAPLVPADLEIVDVDDATLVVRGSFFRGDDPAADELVDDLLRETLMGAFDEANIEGGVRIVDADTGLPLGAHLRDHTPSSLPPRERRKHKALPTSATRPFGGALVGQRIAISAGHGWIDRNGGYGTQRERFTFSSSARGIVEDFFSAEFVSRQLVPLLTGMGAEVVLVRVPDLDDNAPAVLIDATNAHVVEGTFTSSNGGVGGSHLVASSEGDGLVRLPLPTSPRAFRNVTVRFPTNANSTRTAFVTVVHAGGSHTFTVDPAGAAGGFVELGHYVLDASSAVEIAAAPAAGRLVVDAVEVGGGTDGQSTKPWWQMSALDTVNRRRGPDVPSSVTTLGDVTIRPSYAELFDVDAYLSIHANAGANGSASGFSVYRYSCGDYGDHTSSSGATNCDDPVGSRDLIDEIHAATLAELREFDAAFTNRGALVADFGELRALDDTPGVLIETAFFDNVTTPAGHRMSDNRALHDPRFREHMATGIVRGLARFFDTTADAPPARPAGIVVENNNGELVVSWNAVDGALGYRVATATVSADGLRAFNDGVVVEGATQLRLRDVSAGEVVAVRVWSQNENGEGYGSSVVAARVGPAAALLVDAYDRRDAFAQDEDNDLAYAFEHAHAVAAAFLATNNASGFDGASDEAVEAGDVDLGTYAFVDVWCGKDSSEHIAVNKGLQGLLRTYVDGGGRLFLSGEEVGYFLGDASTDPDDAAFLREVLGAVYVADDAESFTATLLGNTVAIDDGTAGVYRVVYPDVIDAADDAAVIGTWPDGTGAMVERADRVIFLATPFEAVVPASARVSVMTDVVTRLGVPDVAAEGEGEGEPGEGEGEGEPGEGEGEGEPGEGEGEPGEGEGEDDAPDRLVITSSVKRGCGCASASPVESIGLSVLLLALRRRRRSSHQ